MRVALGTSVALAVGLLTAVSGATTAAAAARPSLVAAGPASGPPGSAAGYRYTWDSRECTVGWANLGRRAVVLHWDSPATAIGSAPLAVDTATGRCSGTVTGTVPTGAAPGPHRVTAYLEDAGRGGRVPGSFAGSALPFVVTAPRPVPTPLIPPPLPAPVVPHMLAASPTASPAPLPSPSGTPTPTDSAASPAPSSSATAGLGAGIIPSPSAGSGGLAPPGGWVLDISIAAVLLTAAAVTLLAVARGRRPERPDPFEFVR